MTLFLLSARPSLPLFTCHATTASRTQPSPPPSPHPPQTLPLNPSSSVQFPAPLTCALQCPHFQSCSGCTHELNLHHPIIVDEATNFFKKYGVLDFTFDSCKLWGWRCRAKLAVRGSSTNPLIGLYEEGTHNIVDIPHCKAHHPNINAAVDLLKQGITEAEVQPYDEDEGTGDLRYVQMAVTTYNTSLPAAERYKNGKVQVTLVWNSRNENSPRSDKLNALANFLWRNGGPRSSFHLIHSVWANFQTSTNNIIFGNRWRYLLGERDFWEHVGGIDVSLAPSSFGQANTRAFNILLRKLQKYVPYGASVTDLYAGAGAIGLSLAATKKCRSVKCIEINKESKLSFEKTIERLPATIDSSITWHHADASRLLMQYKSTAALTQESRKRKDLGFYVLKKIQSRLEAKHLRRIALSHCHKPLYISVVDGKDSKRTASHCCLIRHGTWKKPMVLIFFLAPKALKFWLYSRGALRKRNQEKRRRRGACSDQQDMD